MVMIIELTKIIGAIIYGLPDVRTYMYNEIFFFTFTSFFVSRSLD